VQAFSRQVESRAAERQQTQVGPSSRFLRHEFADTQQLFFCNHLDADLHRR
jgi:hypothetical protein